MWVIYLGLPTYYRSVLHIYTFFRVRKASKRTKWMADWGEMLQIFEQVDDKLFTLRLLKVKV